MINEQEIYDGVQNEAVEFLEEYKKEIAPSFKGLQSLSTNAVTNICLCLNRVNDLIIHLEPVYEDDRELVKSLYDIKEELEAFLDKDFELE